MVPHDLHVQYAIQCLQSGKHIFLEKPVSHTIEGCIELMKAAESTDKIIMIAENARFWPEVCSQGVRYSVSFTLHMIMVL